MLNRRRKDYKQEKLGMFLEAIENDVDYKEDNQDVKLMVLKLKKQGKSVNEIVDALASTVGPEPLGLAIVELTQSGKLDEGCMKKDLDEGEYEGYMGDEKSDDEFENSDNEEDNDGEDDEESFEKSDDDMNEMSTGDEENMQVEEAYTNQHYKQAVEVINRASERIGEETSVDVNKIKKILAEEFADVFEADNPRFARAKFFKAMSLTEEGDGIEEVEDDESEKEPEETKKDKKKK